jgi:hypothetical protein
MDEVAFRSRLAVVEASMVGVATEEVLVASVVATDEVLATIGDGMGTKPKVFGLRDADDEVLWASELLVDASGRGIT